MHRCLFSERIGKNITPRQKRVFHALLKREVSVINVPLPAPSSPAPLRRNCVDPPVAAHVTINVTVFPAQHVLHSFRTLRLPPLSNIYRFNVKSFLLFTIACSGNKNIPFSQQLYCTEPGACDSKKRLNDDVSV